MGAPDLPLVTEDMTVAGPATTCAALSTPHLLSNLPGSHAFPRIGWSGTNFVAAWNTSVDVMSTIQHRIDVSLVDADGNKLGPNIPLSRMPEADFWAPSVTPLLNGTAVAWTRLGATTSDIVLNTLDASGQRLDVNGVACDPADDTCGEFQVTSSGMAAYPYLERPQQASHTAMPTDTQIGLAFIDQRNNPCLPGPCTVQNDVYWKKLQSNGTVLVNDRRITPASKLFGFPRLAFDGVHEGLVWREDGAGSSTFFFATLDAQGQVSSGPMQIGSASGSFISAGAPDLIWNGAEYALATATGSSASANVVFQRFQSNGVPSLTPVAVSFGGVGCTPAISWDGEYWAVVWQTDCGQPGSNLAFELIDAQGFRVRPDGTSCGNSQDPMCGVVTLTQNTTAVAAFPEIAWMGNHAFGVVWMSTDSPPDAGTQPSQIYFTRVDCAAP
jgi:hypothetical protein